MFSWLARLVSSCLRPVRRYARMSKDGDDDDDGVDESTSSVEDSLLWRRDLLKHSCGEFSFAVVQANEVIEDHSQVEIGSDAIFVGVYDGHGGPEASRFVRDHLFQHLMRIAQDNGTISEEILRGAVTATEDGFMKLVHRSYMIKPLIASIGSCCLVGVIWKGTLYIANLGDSRAVVGSLGRSNKIIAEQLTREHNACREEIRQELRSLHPQDSQIVVMNRGTWRVKGIIQVSRSIGDAYLKWPQFSLDPSFPRFHMPEPITQPVLTAEPSLCSRVLQPHDKFLIFASDGLWEYMTNQQAAEIVQKNPRNGVARKLVKAALKEAANKRKMKYKELQKIEKGNRRIFHDDITVIVVFIDHELLGKKITVPELSIRGFIDSAGPSNFKSVQEFM
ncbi:hypothetical protein AAZX31_19G133900 [Glycine max]|uniref:protein-serine/threonine phosphatase n=1 Tax=Glycine soja TaxID=3848 RepID=A0A0B2SME2_GLYSO|nr:probable protein phosphatase 2C 25 [Glycine soja]KAG4913064.1 hypothetical protein JHK86_053497 [Glycine max]KAG4916006.1 hypothetical protein JHK87_053563 [Glycine soja]KAG5083480.1 hypothetical protein JHK84_053518 [Glycine max]KAG5086251.1 hypothetical protein JHK82_053648 [Glycine max]KAH1077868.1 hypothetical protein GYH30_053089 [Glycine max]